MAKTKSAYFCSNCGFESPKWQGKCPSCNEWNTFVEELVSKSPNVQPTYHGGEKRKSKPQLLKDIETSEESRINMNNEELNRVLGGGLEIGRAHV